MPEGAVGSANVALRVDSAASRLLFECVLSLQYSLTCIIVAFSMYIRVRPFGVVRFSVLVSIVLILPPIGGPGA